MKDRTPYSTAKIGYYGKITHLLINTHRIALDGNVDYVGYTVACRPNGDVFGMGYRDFATLEEAKADTECKQCLKKMSKIEATFITLYKDTGKGEIGITLCPDHLIIIGGLFGILTGSSEDEGRTLAAVSCDACVTDGGDLGFLGMVIARTRRLQWETHGKL